MHTRKRGGALLAALAFALILAGRGAAAAQDEDGEPARRPQAAAKAEVNFEVQLHMLVTAEGADGAARVPQALDGVVRQLKATLPAADYRLGATFVSRVRDGHMVEVRSMGAPPYAGPPQGSSASASFQISLGAASLPDGAAGEKLVRVQPFRFGLRMPFPTGAAGGQGVPVIQFEEVGINTHMSVRDGEPTLVGTLNTSRPGQFIVVVITARRAAK